ncbi:DMT family transporter [Alphaproteobacteria bacterium]|jgi:drug/metabolite transporter (DMT)-like permease|nr:DMT family transporter [Alphaproteobacteria bacterium]MDC1406854.1 DMT family transporter [Candidatus Puniceispirillum sp.]MDA8730046.1 DMT family transporter [Alphaproteobacteria bacterium]MDA9958968.1 DMT family transporter [Alphaproteobacteria bacterium]MDB2638762.1 DMT family transporter [Alphaproteobacteria bacterium]
MMIVSATIVSTAGLIFRSLESIDAFGVVFFRGLALSFVMLIVLNAFYRQRVFLTIWSVGRQGVLGALFFTGAQTFYVFAFSNTTVANTTFTIALAPFITALLAFIVIRERIERTTLLAMAIACLGVVAIIVTDVSSEGLLGVFFALMTAFCFSCFAVTLRRNKHVEMLPVLLLTGIFSMIVGLVFGQWDVIPQIYDIALCFIWGGVLQGFGQSLLVLSTRVLKAAEIPLIMLLEFSLGPIWVWMFFEEIISLGTLFGGGLIFLSVFGLARHEIRKQRSLDG